MKKKWIISAGVALALGALATSRGSSPSPVSRATAGGALALGALATVAVAEPGEKMREHRQPTPWMLGRLDLTDEQKEQLQALRKEHVEARREQREAMAAMGKEQRDAVMNILTDEQQESLKEMRAKRGKFFDRRGWEGKDRHDMRRGGKGRHDAQRGGQGAFSRLDLTDEQKEQFVELRQGAPHRDTRNASKAPHGFGKRLDRRAARKARRDEGRGVLRRQTRTRQAVSTDSYFPSRRGVAGLLRVFYTLSGSTTTIENKNCNKYGSSDVQIRPTTSLCNVQYPVWQSTLFFSIFSHTPLTLNNHTS